MRTVLCESCGRQVTDDLPILSVRFPERRRSTRHAWRRTRYGIFCRDCATAEPQQIPDAALARPATREFLTGAESLEHCESCGAALLLVKVARRKHVYCSPACRAQIYRDAAQVEQVERPCEQCGAPMTGRSDRRFCSSRCRVAAHREAADAAPTLDSLDDEEIALLLAHRQRKMDDLIAEA